MRIINKLSESVKELNSTKNLVILGLLVAIYVVMGYFTFYLLPTLRVTFTYIPLVLAGAMFGPVCGGFVGAIGDVLGYITSQFGAGAYNAGFTVNAFVTGFVYGVFLYRSDFGLLRIIGAKLTVALIVELLLTPIWLSVLYGDAYLVLLIDRIWKTLVFIPIEVIIINFVVKKIYRYVSIKNGGIK